MTDREKIMKAIECCSDYTEAMCDTCPYGKQMACIESLMKDAKKLIMKLEKEIEK